MFKMHENTVVLLLCIVDMWVDRIGIELAGPHSPLRTKLKPIVHSHSEFWPG